MHIDINRKFWEAKKHEKKGNLEGALEYKLKEIKQLKSVPLKKLLVREVALEIDIARSYRTAAKFALKLGRKEENLKYLLKSAVYFWGAYLESKIDHPREKEDMFFVFYLVKKVCGKNHPITEGIEKREKYINAHGWRNKY